ncbi:MAG: monovalent cation:proton antiporter-2 (CPA2) family protein [Nitrospirota bacterium]|nr:monovalent cation:proton antiporter-2 (CPA2) family protein [Nitrospirota bacterium]MDH5768442.1 monovalent cation:proton antiporter-2 (CPA2) family protein [Nitrospirota bacterium]
MEFEVLKSLVIIFGTSALVVFVLHKLKIPTVVGFLVAGILIGPYGIRIIEDIQSIEMLAEIGVILLLFTIGIEFSLAKLIRIKKAVIGGGSIQVLLTIILSAIAAYFVTENTNKSIFFGFLIALSSTAIVLKMLSEKGETDSPHGRIMVGILIFQDICVVPLMLLIPTLSGEGIDVIDIAVKIGKAIMIIAAVLLSARWIVPNLLHQVVHTRSRELFIITIMLLCLGIALLTSQFGLSLALGAFLAGLIISESEYAHQAMSDILPFKESFIGLFFVSVGMLMNVGYVFDNYTKVAIAVLLILGLKILTGMFSALMVGSPLRTSIHTGLGLAQIGEFSFVLAVAGKASGLITEDLYQVFLSSSVVTMIMTPFMVKAAPSVSGWIASRHLLKRLSRLKDISEKEGFPRKRQGHVIIIGFGLNGRNLAKVLKEAEVPYVALEMNNDTVREMKKRGEPIYYGDGTSREILHKLGIKRARLLVVAISDPASTRAIVTTARNENQDIHIIVRTRYIVEVEDLKKLGANEVIPEEFETSVEVFSRVLHHYHIPRNVINEYVENIRNDNYRVLRTIELPRKSLAERYKFLKGIETETFLLKEDSHVDGHSIKELRLRSVTGVTILAVQRGDEIHHNPKPDFVLRKGDIILLIGKREDIFQAMEYFESDKFLVEKYHR